MLKSSLIAICFLSIHAYGEDFSEQVKVTGFKCEFAKVSVHLRSLHADRILYLDTNRSGEGCEAIASDLNAQFTGKVYDVDFHSETFVRRESVFVPPRPCAPGGTKCDEGYFVERDIQYRRTETFLGHHRFFEVREIRQNPPNGRERNRRSPFERISSTRTS